MAAGSTLIECILTPLQWPVAIIDMLALAILVIWNIVLSLKSNVADNCKDHKDHKDLKKKKEDTK